MSADQERSKAAARATCYFDGYRVELRADERWHCECDEFALLASCEHTTQAAALAVPTSVS